MRAAAKQRRAGARLPAREPPLPLHLPSRLSWPRMFSGSFPGYVRAALHVLCQRWREWWAPPTCPPHIPSGTDRNRSPHQQLLADSHPLPSAHQHAFTFPLGALVVLLSKEGGAGVVENGPPSCPREFPVPGSLGAFQGVSMAWASWTHSSRIDVPRGVITGGPRPWWEGDLALVDSRRLTPVLCKQL